MACGGARMSATGMVRMIAPWIIACSFLLFSLSLPGKKDLCFGRASLRIKMAPIGCFYYISLLVALSYLTVSTKWVRGERPED